MGKEMTEQELRGWQRLYHDKNAWLRARFEELDRRSFYREVFPVGTFERSGRFEDGKPNGIVRVIEGDGKRWHRGSGLIVFDELAELEEFDRCGSAIISPVGYFGRRRTNEAARFIYALVFDLDKVEMNHLRDIVHQMTHHYKYIPHATYLVLSGSGVHLYYHLDKPIILYPENRKRLNKLKKGLTEIIWNDYTSGKGAEGRQFQSAFQGYRIVGSPSSLGLDYPVTAYRVGERVGFDYLNDFLGQRGQGAESPISAPKGNLKECREKYPEWYERRVVQKMPRGIWTVKRDLYDWWLKEITKGAVSGHRFYCIFTLMIMAAKCGISENELREDAYGLLGLFESRTVNDDNHFIAGDIETALSSFSPDYATFPRDDIAKYSGISIKANKRNGRSQEEHLEIARAVRDVVVRRRGKSVWWEGNGRPSARRLVIDWREENPDGRKADCVRETGLSKKTVYRWWDEKKTLEEMLGMLGVKTGKEALAPLVKAMEQNPDGVRFCGGNSYEGGE